MKITTDRNVKYQVFEGIGASGAWWAQVVGGWEHVDEKSGLPVKERIAQLLYDNEHGIGMRTYRYNLGGGSKNSGSSVFHNKNRMAESFDVSETQYDWSRDKNAVEMLNLAVKYGAQEVILFSNSPPERWTKNHKSCLDKAWHTNLARENEANFARYLADCAEHFLSEGVPVKYVSPVNEPFWIWTEKQGQEGCHYTPFGVRRILRQTALEFEKRPALKGVKLSGAENGDIRWFNGSYTRAVLSDEVIRRNVDAIDVHSYFLNDPLNCRTVFLRGFRKWLDRRYPGIDAKTSEWTHMKGGRDKGMDSALETAKVMFEDISILNVTSWQHWIAVSEVDYCDGLIYINEDDKTFETTKRLYVTGNFSKYIPYGARRIKAVCDDAEVSVLAFDCGEKTVVIAINPTSGEKTLALGLQSNVTVAVTDDKHNLYEYAAQDASNLKLTARSVTTFVCD